MSIDLMTEMDLKMSKNNFPYFFEKVLGYELADFHNEWLEFTKNTDRTVIICSRDHGKSVFFHSWAVWQLCFQEPPYQMLYISSNHKQTMVHMKDIDRMFTNVPQLKKFKPRGGWAVGAMRLTNGNEILERSVGSQIRGLHLWGNRWDLEKLEARKMEIGSMKFTREYLCVPISTNTMLFDPSHINECKDREARLHSSAREGYRYYIGYDPAISANGDFTVMMVIEVDDDMNKQVVHMFRAKGLDFREHITHIMNLCKRYQPEIVMIETNTFAKAFAMELKNISDFPVREFTMSRKKKEEIILNLQMNIDNHKLVLPMKDETSRGVTKLIEQELGAFGINANGKIEGVGAHDDIVIALALANYATKQFSDTFIDIDGSSLFNPSPTPKSIGGGIYGIN